MLTGKISVDPDVIARLGPSTANMGIIQNTSVFYNSIDVALSPVRFGSGLKIKVFEALSYGKPVLATQHSIDGFPSNIEDVVTVVDDIGSWDLTTVKTASEKPSAMIKDYFTSHFSEERCMDILREVL